MMKKNQKYLQKTNLYENHIALGAQMIPYCGFFMPLQYTSSLQEHMAVRKYAGIFDISHMGKLMIQGKNSKEYIQYLTTNDLNKIYNGRAQYNCLINEKGGIIDDVVVYQISEEQFLIITNSCNTKKDKYWMNNYLKNFDQEINLLDISSQYSLIAVQGPLSLFYIQKLTKLYVDHIPFYNFIIGEICGINNILISNTGYTGSCGLELLVPNKHIHKIWNAILEEGKNKLIPCGLSSRDSLRIEMGYRLYGQDLSEDTTPIESGLSWIVSFNKNFLSKDILEKQKKIGGDKKFFSFYMNEKFIPRKGNILFNKYGENIGYVTSGNFSPILKKGIGLGYIYSHHKNRSNIYILIRKNKIPIIPKKIPFI